MTQSSQPVCRQMETQASYFVSCQFICVFPFNVQPGRHFCGMGDLDELKAYNRYYN